MTNVVQANFEELQHVAQRFAQQAEIIAQLINLLQTRQESLLNGGWQGRGADAFFAEMSDDFMPGLHRLRDALEQASQATKQIQMTLQTAEEEAANPFGNAQYGGAANFVPGTTSGVNNASIGGQIANLGNMFDQIWGGQVGNLPGTILPGVPWTGGGFWDGGGSFPTGISPNMIDSINSQFGFGAGTGLPTGAFLPGNNFGIPQDWLAGVTGSLPPSSSSGAGLGSGIIPENWLEGVVLEAPATDGMESSGGGAMSAGGSGGGPSGGTAPDTAAAAETSTEPATPSSGGSGGSGSSTPTDISSPYSGGERSFATRAGETPTATAGSGSGFTYQASSGSGTGAARPQEAVGTGVTAVSASAPSAPTATSESNTGLALGLAAASPLVAVLGKFITGQQNKS